MIYGHLIGRVIFSSMAFTFANTFITSGSRCFGRSICIKLFVSPTALRPYCLPSGMRCYSTSDSRNSEHNINIPLDKLDFSFARSSGPGKMYLKGNYVIELYFNRSLHILCGRGSEREQVEHESRSPV